jgi:Zn-dependent protease
MPVVAGLFAEGKTWKEYGSFRLGGLSKLFAIIVGIGAVVVTVAGHIFVPSIQADATAGTGYVPGLWVYSVAFAVLLGLFWLISENKRFKGPPMGAEIAKRQAAIAASEKALAGK